MAFGQGGVRKDSLRHTNIVIINFHKQFCLPAVVRLLLPPLTPRIPARVSRRPRHL